MQSVSGEKKNKILKKARAKSLLALAFLFVFLAFGQQAQGASAAEEIVVGSISVSPKEETEKYQEFISYLASKLTEFGYSRGRVVVASSMKEMTELVRKGEVDLFIDSPFALVHVAHEANGQIILRRWKKGAAEYSSVIFVRKDSPIQTIQDLKGKRLAFDEPYSTSGFFLPKSVLIEEGLDFAYTALLKDMESSSSQVAYGFSFDPENAIVWVLRGKVDAAVTDEDTYQKMASADDRLRILYKTRPVPRQLLLHRSGLEPKVTKKIEEILSQMHLDKEGAGVLERFEATSKFDPITPALRKQIDEIQILSEHFNLESA